MTDQPTEHDFFVNKRSDKIYLSKALEQTLILPDHVEGYKKISRPFRIVSKVFDGTESHEFIKKGQEFIVRVTEGKRQEVVIKFYEDTRGIFTLQFQKFSSDGIPHKSAFSFINDEIPKLYNFIRNVALLPISGSQAHKFDDKYLEEIILTKEQALKIIYDNPEILSEILKNNISKADITALGYRKDQLAIFKNLLYDQKFFDRYKLSENESKSEGVWQSFFEANTWIFGYGLNYIFNTPLAGKKLEQVVSGYNTFKSGKRIDALMQTKGLVSSLCFGEIKTHMTPLLHKEYRPEAYSISDEVSGGIAQVHKTIQKSLKELNTKLDIKDNDRNPTGENVFLYQPKAFLIVGSLEQFRTPSGVNEDKFSSFELFRRSINNPEIITFDELYERARYIVEFSEQTSKTNH